MVPDVKERSAHSERGDLGPPRRRTPESRAHAERDEPHVLDAGIGKHPLHVALVEREGDAEQTAE